MLFLSKAEARACLRLLCATALLFVHPYAAIGATVPPPLDVKLGMAFQPMDDEELQAVDGEGLAIALEDWRFSMEPTGYIEQIGTNLPTPRPSGMSFRRGDMRWFGLTMSSAYGAGTHWTEGTCADTGYNGLGCPRGGPVALFAAHDNPYIVRAFNYPGIELNGSNANRTVFDILAPTAGMQDAYRFAFMGEVEVDKGNQFPNDPGAQVGTGGRATHTNVFKSQTMIQGNASGSMLRMFRVADPLGANSTDPDSQTLGIMYWSHMRGDFRFSMAQEGVTSDVPGVAVQFHAREGLHFRDVDAYFPLGQFFYQALTLDSTRNANGTLKGDGNFVWELNRIPNVAAVYNDFYSLAPGDTLGYSSARSARSDISLSGVYTHNNGTQGSQNWSQGHVYYHDATSKARYLETHGYVRWGNWFPCGGVGCSTGHMSPKPGPATDNQGMFFVGRSAYTARTYRWDSLDAADMKSSSCHSSGQGCGANVGMQYGAEGVVARTHNVAAGTPLNIGTSRVEGMVVHHFRLTSLGANQ